MRRWSSRPSLSPRLSDAGLAELTSLKGLGFRVSGFGVSPGILEFRAWGSGLRGLREFRRLKVRTRS